MWLVHMPFLISPLFCASPPQVTTNWDIEIDTKQGSCCILYNLYSFSLRLTLDLLNIEHTENSYSNITIYLLQIQIKTEKLDFLNNIWF